MAEQSGLGPLEGNHREGRGVGSNSHSRPHTLCQKSSMTTELPLFLKAIKRVLLQEQLRWEWLRSWRLRGEIKHVTSLTSETIPPITDRNTILPHSSVTDRKTTPSLSLTAKPSCLLLVTHYYFYFFRENQNGREQSQCSAWTCQYSLGAFSSSVVPTYTF